MPRKKIAVLTGQGISTGQLVPRLRESFRGAAIDEIGYKDLHKKATLNEDTLAFVLPGIVGDHSPYNKNLGWRENRAIRKYVEMGGVYVGICAGAYFASHDIKYDPHWLPEPKTRKSPLSFFNALAQGPVPGYAKMYASKWYTDCSVLKLSFTDADQKQNEAGIFYGNGPMLYPHEHDPGLEVIARYADLPDQPIAIAAKKIGSGLAFFVGPLPYIGHIPLTETPENERLVQLMNSVKPYEKARDTLWTMITDRVKRHNIELGRAQPFLVHNQP